MKDYIGKNIAELFGFTGALVYQALLKEVFVALIVAFAGGIMGKLGKELVKYVMGQIKERKDHEKNSNIK